MLIKIIVPSYNASSAQIQSYHTWYEHWIGEDLKREFSRRGYDVATSLDQKADVDLVCGGLGVKYKHWLSAPKRYWWIFNHVHHAMRPEEREFTGSFNHIFLGSHTYLPVFQERFPKSSTLMYATSKRLKHRTVPPKYDIVFNGNDKGERRQFMSKLVGLNRYSIHVVGHGWNWLSGDKVSYGGEYYPYERFADFYNSGWLTFFSGHATDRQTGFTYQRHFDVFASSECLMITEHYDEWEHIFSGIPYFRTFDDLISQIDHYLNHKEKIKPVADQCRREISGYTYESMIDEMEKYLA